MWGSGDGAAHLPASCPDLRVCPPLSEAASWDVVPDTQQPGRNVRLRAAAREGPQRRDVCRVSSLPFGMLARQSVALTLGLAGTRASSPPSAPRPCLLPSPSTPDPVSAFPPRRWGWGWSLFSHVGDGEEQALLREGTPASHSTVAGLHKPRGPRPHGKAPRDGGRGALQQHTPTPQATAKISQPFWQMSASAAEQAPWGGVLLRERGPRVQLAHRPAPPRSEVAPQP